jgi:uncharacterized protein YjbJ (UPF0337 family)
MKKEHVKSATDKAKVSVKDTPSKLMDDQKLQVDGKHEMAKGSAPKKHRLKPDTSPGDVTIPGDD